MLLVCIGVYLKSVLRYKFLILDTCLRHNVYLGEQGCEDPWLFYETKRNQRAKIFGKQWFRRMSCFSCSSLVVIKISP